MARVTSPHRVPSRDQAQAFLPKRAPSAPNHRNNGTKSKPGFTIASPDDNDEDEWVSSESGAATPNHHCQSDSESEHFGGSTQHRAPAEPLPDTPRTEPSGFSRVDTARPSDFALAAPRPVPSIPDRSETRTPLPPSKSDHSRNAPNFQPHDRGVNHHTSDVDAFALPSPRMSSKRHCSTRPPSTHSVRSDALRPHPLIRGQSYGQVYPAKPAPLEPLTVIQDAASSSPPSTLFDYNQLSTSPTSIKTTATSPPSPDGGSSHPRRTSVSSVTTLPTHSSLRDSVNWTSSVRKRTLSHSSSSAALTSLVHLPTITRPPSPQAISFFPPFNPHTNIEGIHPLLPGPYLHNHLTVLARRTPIKESFDRVTRAKHELQA